MIVKAKRIGQELILIRGTGLLLREKGADKGGVFDSGLEGVEDFRLVHAIIGNAGYEADIHPRVQIQPAYTNDGGQHQNNQNDR